MDMPYRKEKPVFNRPIAGLALVSLLVAGNGIAENTQGLIYLTEAPLDNYMLDQQRGGFLDVDGFKVNIGFEKVLVVDGVMVARSRLVMPDISGRVDQAVSEGMQKLDVAMDNLDQMLGRAGIDVDEVKEAMPVESMNLDSNAQSGIRTDTATLSQLGLVQVAEGGNAPAAGQQASAAEAVGAAVQSVSQPAPVSVAMPGTRLRMNDTNTLIQNTADNRLIQTLQVVNIDLAEVSRKTARSSVRSRLLPQIIHSIR